jgi:hypothetical protein
VPAPPHASDFFPQKQAKSIFAGSSEVLRTKAAVRQMPARKHERLQARGRIWRAGGVDMSWSVISQESNQPDRSTEINVHGHG